MYSTAFQVFSKELVRNFDKNANQDTLHDPTLKVTLEYPLQVLGAAFNLALNKHA